MKIEELPQDVVALHGTTHSATSNNQIPQHNNIRPGTTFLPTTHQHNLSTPFHQPSYYSTPPPQTTQATNFNTPSYSRVTPSPPPLSMRFQQAPLPSHNIVSYDEPAHNTFDNPQYNNHPPIPHCQHQQNHPYYNPPPAFPPYLPHGHNPHNHVYAPAVHVKRKLKNGTVSVKPKPPFPGCIFLRCVLNKELYDTIRECLGIGDFIGSKVGNTPPVSL
ncbi:Transcription termination/antitermination protein NusG [Thalictrum thalictroides]|uniref:Transcription termination/antitermination protein NusG n=1 Tax=Thalictrum thalictroides TaxID=46969 RepID=A0A7J6WYU3_THATH|nr:Transcription termination/antitermination protein NusG [Thalictrum thalictroides]